MWKVLIAQSEAAERAELTEILNGSSRPIEIVAEAADGSAALMLAAIEEPDLFILDLDLPDLPAIEMLRRIHSMDSEVPVLVICRAEDRDRACETLATGASDYVLKPLDRETLLQSVDAALGSLREMRDTERYQRSAREEFARSLPGLREAFLRDFLSGRLDPALASEDLDFLMLDIPEPATLLLLRIREESLSGLDRRERLMRLYCLKALVAERFPSEFACLVFEDGQRSLGVIGEEASCGDWAAAAEEITEKAARRFGLDLEASLGQAAEAALLADAWAGLRGALQRSERTNAGHQAPQRTLRA